MNCVKLRIHLVLAALLVATFGFAQPGQKSYGKAYDKSVTRIAKTLTHKSIHQSIRIQGKTYQCTSTSGFYNASADAMFYVLTCDDGSTIHYQFPIERKTLEVSRASLKKPLWLLCLPQGSFITTRIYNKKGAMVYTSSAAERHLPVADVKTVKRMDKFWAKAIQAKYGQ